MMVMSDRRQQIKDSYYGILEIVKDLRKRDLCATADHMMNQLQQWSDRASATAPTLYEISDTLCNDLKTMYDNFKQATKSCIDFKEALLDDHSCEPTLGIHSSSLSKNSDNSPDILNKGGVNMTWKDTMRAISNADKLCGIEIMELLQYMDFHLDRIIEAKAKGDQKAIEDQAVFLNKIRSRLTELEYFPLVGGTSDLLPI